MATAPKLRMAVVLGPGVFMLCLGMALSALGSYMTVPTIESSGYIAAVLLTAACLLGPVLVACIGISLNGYWRRREVWLYLWLGIFSVVCWLAFWFIRLAPLEMLVVLAGFHGLFWSIYYVGLALHLQLSPLKSTVLCVLAGTTSAIGIILATLSNLTDLGAVTAVACYITWIGTQNLLLLPYLFNNLESGTAGVFATDN